MKRASTWAICLRAALFVLALIWTATLYAVLRPAGQSILTFADPPRPPVEHKQDSPGKQVGACEWAKKHGGVQAPNESTVIWYGTMEGFSQWTSAFSSAMSYAQRTNRTLLLQPISSTHVRLNHTNNIYMDDLVELPVSMQNVVIRHVPRNLSCAFSRGILPQPICGHTTWSRGNDIPFVGRDGLKIGGESRAQRAKLRKYCSGKNRCFKSLLHQAIKSPHVEIYSWTGRGGHPTRAVPFVSKGALRETAHEVRRSLFKDGQARPIWAVHWRRGDRCKAKGKGGSKRHYRPGLVESPASGY